MFSFFESGTKDDAGDDVGVGLVRRLLPPDVLLGVMMSSGSADVVVVRNSGTADVLIGAAVGL